MNPNNKSHHILSYDNHKAYLSGRTENIYALTGGVKYLLDPPVAVMKVGALNSKAQGKQRISLSVCNVSETRDKSGHINCTTLRLMEH